MYAIKRTFNGTSPLMWVVILLNYSQNFIILIPKGPNACPILGFGFATPAKTFKVTVAEIKK